MPSLSNAELDALEVDYARFNAKKTVSSAAPSRFECFKIGPLTVTRDRAREDAYYNRIFGLDTTSRGALDRALALFDTQAVRVDLATPSDAIAEDLRARGFTRGEDVAWLRAEADPDAPDDAPEGLRELTPRDHPAIRSLLETDGGPISDAIWEQKRHHLCTDTFRWTGIFAETSGAGDVLVAAASTWVAPHVALFGSAQTREEARRQGHQNALIRARCRQTSGLLVVDVEPNSTSHRNCERNGFTFFALRHTWVRQTS